MLAPKTYKRKTCFFQSLLAIFIIVLIVHLLVDTAYIALVVDNKIVQRDQRMRDSDITKEQKPFYNDNFYFDKSIARYPGPLPYTQYDNGEFAADVGMRQQDEKKEPYKILASYEYRVDSAADERQLLPFLSSWDEDDPHQWDVSDPHQTCQPFTYIDSHLFVLCNASKLSLNDVFTY